MFKFFEKDKSYKKRTLVSLNGLIDQIFMKLFEITFSHYQFKENNCDIFGIICTVNDDLEQKLGLGGLEMGFYSVGWRGSCLSWVGKSRRFEIVQTTLGHMCTLLTLSVGNFIKRKKGIFVFWFGLKDLVYLIFRVIGALGVRSAGRREVG